MAVVKRCALAILKLIIKTAEFALFVREPPVVAFADIANGSKSADIVSGTSNNANLCTGGVSRVAGNDVDGAQKGINAIGG